MFYFGELCVITYTNDMIPYTQVFLYVLHMLEMNLITEPLICKADQPVTDLGKEC